MALFALADTHLSEKLNKPMDVFGNRWTGYREKLIEGWRSVVTEADTVVVPGDISWGMSLAEAEDDLRLLDSLPGKKLIGRGNHDYWWNTERKMKEFFAERGFSTLQILHNNAYTVDSFLILGSRGWFSDVKKAPDGTDSEKIAAREAIRIGLSAAAGRKLLQQDGRALETLLFLHFPPAFHGQDSPAILNAIRATGAKRVYFGHIHGMYREPETVRYGDLYLHLISADYLNFVPKRIIPGGEET